MVPGRTLSTMPKALPRAQTKGLDTPTIYGVLGWPKETQSPPTVLLTKSSRQQLETPREACRHWHAGIRADTGADTDAWYASRQRQPDTLHAPMRVQHSHLSPGHAGPDRQARCYPRFSCLQRRLTTAKRSQQGRPTAGWGSTSSGGVGSSQPRQARVWARTPGPWAGSHTRGAATSGGTL